MLKIACHDAASGEAPANLLSWLMIPFARTQSKTIKEQYNAGCRLFDIRVRKYKGEWHCAHGLFVTKRKAYDIIREINAFPERCQVAITYEGGMEENESFKLFFVALRAEFSHIRWGYAAVKYGEDSQGIKVNYSFLIPSTNEYEGGVQGFLPLDGKTWHIYLPIPYLWWFVYNRNPKFNERVYTYVDFL